MQYATLPAVPLTTTGTGAPGAFNYIASDASGRHVFAVGTPSVALLTTTTIHDPTTTANLFTAGTLSTPSAAGIPVPTLPAAAICNSVASCQTTVGNPIIMVSKPSHPYPHANKH